MPGLGNRKKQRAERQHRRDRNNPIPGNHARLPRRLHDNRGHYRALALPGVQISDDFRGVWVAALQVALQAATYDIAQPGGNRGINICQGHGAFLIPHKQAGHGGLCLERHFAA